MRARSALDWSQSKIFLVMFIKLFINMYKKPAELSQTSQITWVMFLPKIIKNQKNPDVTKRGDDDDDDI